MTEEESVRLERLRAMREKGIDPFPSTVNRTHTLQEVLDQFDSLEKSTATVQVVGRVRLIRKHGGLTFLQLQDGSAMMQAALKRDEIGLDVYEQFHTFTDVGDFLAIEGVVFLTKKGERTIDTKHYTLLSKSLRPLPEKWHGLTDIEARYRQRELDLIVNPDVKDRFVKRANLIASLRQFLNERDFLEVETPVLQPIPGGANARPFQTHHNALDADLYLRIAPELYLKRLIIGGFEKIFEIGRVFRNEGIDFAHNPEFTMLELYWAYVPSKDVFVDFLEETLRHTIMATIGSHSVPYGAETIDFGAAWPRFTFREAIINACGIDIDTCRSERDVLEATNVKNLKIDFGDAVGIGEYYDQLFKKTARIALKEPTWIFDYPIELKPLAKACPSDPSKSSSVQLVVHGMEIVNAYYHELNDPIDQRKRLELQETLRERGSQDAQFLDEEFLSAMMQGMPPTSGVGIGIDRLIAFLTDAPNLKEVILFPTLRTKTD